MFISQCSGGLGTSLVELLQLSFVCVSTCTPHPRTATGSVRGTDSVAQALLVPSNYRAALLRSRFPVGPGMSKAPAPFLMWPLTELLPCLRHKNSDNRWVQSQ